MVVFAHAPQIERSAKPLLPPLHGEASAGPNRAVHVQRLHKSLLERALQTAARVTGAEVLLFTTGNLDQAAVLAADAVPGFPVRVLLQQGDTFAARLQHAVAHAFSTGDEQVVVIGSDTPSLDSAHLEAAYAGLHADAIGASPRAVIGPATDGGYYLLGLSAFSAAPFLEIPFGTRNVASMTQAALHGAGFKLLVLPPLADIDDAADLAALLGMAMLPLVRLIGLWGTRVSLGAAHSLWTLPIVYLVVRAALEEVDPDLERVARGLGAGPLRAFFYVTVPTIAPALITPAIETLPKVIWPNLRYTLTPLVAAASGVMLLLTLLGLGILARLRRVRDHAEVLAREAHRASRAA